MATQENIDRIIDFISITEEMESITNDMVGKVLQYLNSGYKTILDQLIPRKAYTDASGFILAKKLPSEILYSNDPKLREKLPSAILYSDDPKLREKLPSGIVYDDNLALKAFLPLFEAAISPQGDTLWSEADFDRREMERRKSGYYPMVNAGAPFYVAGHWLTLTQAMTMISDRYTPYMGGVQCSAAVNLPVKAKSSDSSLSLDYAAVNNPVPYVIALGVNGWEDSIRPTSARRAFHGCWNLQAVVGEIDMRLIPSAWEANNLFGNCPNLWQFHLANIPDCIETLDLSGVSEHIIDNFTFGEGAQQTSSSLKYLLKNFRRDIERTKPLTVVVSQEVFAVVGSPGDIFWSDSMLTWATA